MNDEQNVTESETNSVSPDATQSEAPVSESSFIDSLAEDLRGNESLAKFKDINSLAKSYIHAEQRLGRAISIPGEDAGAEQIEAFRQQLQQVKGVGVIPEDAESPEFGEFMQKYGRPESADKYELNAPEGINLVDDKVNEFKEFALKNNLTQKQAQAVTEMYIQEKVAEAESRQQTQLQTIETLRKAWGTQTEAKLEAAKAGMQMFANTMPDAVQQLTTSALGDNPAVVMAFAQLAEAYAEKGSIPSEAMPKHSGITPEVASEKLNEIMKNKEHAYWNERDPQHSEAVKKVAALGKVAYGS